jgi:hypothetical protein
MFKNDCWALPFELFEFLQNVNGLGNPHDQLGHWASRRIRILWVRSHRRLRGNCSSFYDDWGRYKFSELEFFDNNLEENLLIMAVFDAIRQDLSLCWRRLIISLSTSSRRPMILIYPWLERMFWAHHHHLAFLN